MIFYQTSSRIYLLREPLASLSLYWMQDVNFKS